MNTGDMDKVRIIRDKINRYDQIPENMIDIMTQKIKEVRLDSYCKIIGTTLYIRRTHKDVRRGTFEEIDDILKTLLDTQRIDDD